MALRKTATVVLGAGVMACLAVPARPQTRKVSIDASNVTGTIRSLQGVNLGPLSSRPGGPDLSKQYKDIGVSFVRTHDFNGPTDIDAYRRFKPLEGTIFPSWDADT